MKKICFALLIALLFSLCGCFNQSPVLNYKKITPEEAESMITESTIILDTRTKLEFDCGHIENAISFADFNEQDKEKTVLVYGKTERDSEESAKKLLELGFKSVFDFGSVADWKFGLPPTYHNYLGGELPPNIVTPIDFTTTQKISSEHLEFTFHLTGENIKKYGTTKAETKYYINSNDNNIKSITITDNSGNMIQQITDLSTMNPSPEYEMYGLEFDDWNFDGFMDLSLWQSPGGTMLNSPHYYWLWDNNLGQFVENRELMEISDVSFIEIDDDKKELNCFARYGAGGGKTDIYKFSDGKFILVHSSEYMVSSNGEKTVRHTIEKNLVNGELITKEYDEELN